MNLSILDILKNLNLSNIVSNTNKTLGIIKKTIPVYRQIKPYITHEKSFLKKDKEITNKLKESNIINNEINHTYNDTLTFFK